jgi:hypothetical protein
MKFRRRGITQKKEQNIQNMAKVWNQEMCKSSKSIAPVTFIMLEIYPCDIFIQINL